MTPCATPVRRASIPYTRRYMNMTANIVWVATLVVTIGAVSGADPGADAGAPAAVEFAGAGQWGHEHAAPANATWLVIDTALHAFVVEQEGDRFPCYPLLDPPDPLSGSEDGPYCQGERLANGTYHMEWRDGGAIWSGTFSPERTAALLEVAPPDGPSVVPGLIITIFAAVFLAASLVLGALFLQERRVARYLVRRLYEETKGRMPPDWPKHLRQQWIARAFIRGKN